MTECFLLLTHGQMILIVIGVIFLGRASADIQKICGKLQIFLLSRVFVHSEKRKLDLLVTGGDKRRRALLDENALDKIDVFKHAVVKLVLAGCLLVGDSRLDKVTRAVKLVVVAVCPFVESML